ncbi:uncharacterized protein LOC121417364 [Lytechinus variegatus]|uniref:uncharacterized protein LOC121417364 n=1 Tax=Lytechinus variegatus TaxID=7654 RepID=UPI001BB1D8CF|nr:uncharacterized protein LOC121417364 [Lytechinus variegatus]
MVLLWRDDLGPEDDQRALLIEKLLEAGLEDQLDKLLNASPGPTPPSPGYSYFGATDTSIPSRTNAPVLPMKLTKKGTEKDKLSSPAMGHSYSETVAAKPEPESHTSRPGHTGDQGSGQDFEGRSDDKEDDTDDSDPENYINVSNRVLHRGSKTVSVAFEGKPVEAFQGSQENRIREEAEGDMGSTESFLQPCKLVKDRTTGGHDDLCCDQADVLPDTLKHTDSPINPDSRDSICSRFETNEAVPAKPSVSIKNSMESRKPVEIQDCTRVSANVESGSKAQTRTRQCDNEGVDCLEQRLDFHEASTTECTLPESSNSKEKPPKPARRKPHLLPGNSEVTQHDKETRKGDFIYKDKPQTKPTEQCMAPNNTHMSFGNQQEESKLVKDPELISDANDSPQKPERRGVEGTSLIHKMEKAPNHTNDIDTDNFNTTQPMKERCLTRMEDTPDQEQGGVPSITPSEPSKPFLGRSSTLTNGSQGLQSGEAENTLSPHNVNGSNKSTTPSENYDEPRHILNQGGSLRGKVQQEHTYASIPEVQSAGKPVVPFKPKLPLGSDLAPTTQDPSKSLPSLNAPSGTEDRPLQLTKTALEADIEPSESDIDKTKESSSQLSPNPLSVAHGSSEPGSTPTQVAGNLSTRRKTKPPQQATGNGSKHFGSLLRKTAPSTPGSTMNKQGSSFQSNKGLSEDILRALAGDVTDGQKLQALGLELGFKEADINGFEAMNHRTCSDPVEGTLDMLMTWQSRVSQEDQLALLKHALRRTGLTMAEAHLRSTKRRRDITGVSVTKNFTVSDCREKLQFHYRIETCKGLKKHEHFPSYLPIVDVHRIVKRGKNVYVEKTPLKDGSVKEILRTRKDGALPSRIVIFGPSGIGKSTLVAQMAHDWAERVPGSPLNDVLLLFVLKMKFMTNHGTLGQAIVNQLLSDVRGLTAQGIDQLIEDNQTECMVVLDGLDEFRGEVSSVRCGHVLRVLQNIQLRTCRVVVTSHTRLEDYFNKEDLPKDFLKFELRGLSHVQSTSFIRSFFEQNSLHRAKEMIVFLEMNDIIRELLATPLFCIIACHLWESNLLQLVTTESEFYDSVNRFLLKQKEEQASMVPGDTDLEIIVQGIGEVALNGLLDDPRKRFFGPNDFKKIPSALEKATSIGILNKTSPKKRDETEIEFYHRHAQVHCAARYLSKDVTSKSIKGKQSRLEKALKQMAKKNLVEFGSLLRFTAELGSPSTRLQVIEAITSADNIPIGDKTRMVLDCLSEIPQLDKPTMYVVERCFEGGNVVINLPTLHTTLGLYKLHPSIKEKIRGLKIQGSFMTDLVAKRLSTALQGCSDLLKLEFADLQNAAYPLILLLLNKLSLHLFPDGAMSILPDLHQTIFNGLRIVDLSDCNLSPEVTCVLWTALARCPKIELMSVKNSTILGKDLPNLGCIADLQANLRSPILQDEVGWLASVLGDTECSTKVKLTIGDAGDGSLRRVGLGTQEHIVMAGDRLELNNATENTLKVLSVLPDTYRRKVRKLCISGTRFTYDLTHPLLDFVHSLIRLEVIATEGTNIPGELQQLQVFKGSSHRDMNQLPSLGPDGILTGCVSSPLREEEFERLSSVFNFSRTTTLKQVHLLIEHDSSSEEFRETLVIEEDNIDLSNVSSATIEILKMLPPGFKQKMHSARIKNCTLTDELTHQLSQALQSMIELEMCLSENSILGRKAFHLKSVTVLDVGRFSSQCFDWEWLASAKLLEELHLTFEASPPSTPTSPSTPGTPVAATSPLSAKNRIYEEIHERMDTADVEGAPDEDFFLTTGRLVMKRMSSCSLSVMLHLPQHMKDELRFVRIRSTKLTVDVLNRLSDVRNSFKHLKPLSLQNLYRRPIKYGCIMQPGSSDPVLGQWD